MDALLMVLGVGAALLVAYVTYGRWVAGRVFQLREDTPTPATVFCDNKDYCPTPKSIVFGHHFTSIAGTGPIVGPAIAVMWGWLPAILWVVFGSVFIGAVHDLGSLVVSLRNKGRSVGDIAGDLLGPRVRLIFLVVLVMALWIVLAIFGLVVATVLRQYPGAIFPVLVQIPLALVIGVAVHRRGRSILTPSLIALGLMYASVVWGDFGPLHAFNATLAMAPMWVWVVGLLVYSYVASVLPVWSLLQPRDYINALQLISALGLLLVGLIVAATIGGAPDDFAGDPAQAVAISTPTTSLQAPSAREGSPASTNTEAVSQATHNDPSPQTPPTGRGRQTADATPPAPPERPRLEIVAPMVNWQPEGAPPLLPVLFITIACGAVSGFHCLVGSGTTSKQVRRETDARAIGYGSMLTEAFLATLVIASCAAGIGLGITRHFDFISNTGGIQLRPDTADRLQGYHETQSSADFRAPDGGDVYLVYRSRIFDVTEKPNPDWGHPHPPQYYGIGEPSDEDKARKLVPPSRVSVYTIREGTKAHEANVSAYLSRAQSPYELFYLWTRYHHPQGVPPTETLSFNDPDGTQAISVLDNSVSFQLSGNAYSVTGRLAWNKQYESWASAQGFTSTIGAFVEGAANLIKSLGVSGAVAVALMGVLVASFAGTTMDTTCRLQRYVIQELARTFLPRLPIPSCSACGYDLRGHASAPSVRRGSAAHPTTGETPVPLDEVTPSQIICPECGAENAPPNQAQETRNRNTIARLASPLNPFRWLATAHGATLFAVLSAIALAAVPAPGQPWNLANFGQGGLILWPLFGATNQLLGGLSFLVIGAWLIATKRPWWFIALPTVFMLIVPAWAMIWQTFIGNTSNPSWLAERRWMLVSVAVLTIILEVWLVGEVALHAVRARASRRFSAA